MYNAEVKLDQFFAMRTHDSLDSIKNFNISSIIGRFSVRELLEVHVVSNLAKGATLGRVFCPCLIVRTESQDLWVMFST